MRHVSVLPLLLVVACAAPTDDTVRFEIAMSGPLQEGWFDAASDSVGLRGSSAPLSWSESVPMTDPEGDGVYELELAFPVDAPKVVQYKVFVTGEGNPNGGWERGDNRWLNRDTMPVVRRAYEDSPDPIPPSYTGTVVEHAGFGRGDLAGKRDLIVWLPPGYGEDPDRRYPVLYLHDGQNVFDARAAGAEWGIDETATRLLEQGAIDPIIVVGVANTARRVFDYTPVEGGIEMRFERTGEGSGSSPIAGVFRESDDPSIQAEIRGDARLEIRWPGRDGWIPVFVEEGGWTVPSEEVHIRADSGSGGRVERFTATRLMGGGGGRDYARFLVEEVKPFIDSTYATRPDRASTALGGSSLGGLITMAMGSWHPDVFGGLLVVSPTAFWGRYAILDLVRGRAVGPRPRVWLDMGTAEGPVALRSARRLRDALLEEGWVEGTDLSYVEDVGAPHNEDAWARRADGMLRFLYGR